MQPLRRHRADRAYTVGSSEGHFQTPAVCAHRLTRVLRAPEALVNIRCCCGHKRGGSSGGKCVRRSMSQKPAGAGWQPTGSRCPMVLTPPSVRGRITGRLRVGSQHALRSTLQMKRGPDWGAPSNGQCFSYEGRPPVSEMFPFSEGSSFNIFFLDKGLG